MTADVLDLSEERGEVPPSVSTKPDPAKVPVTEPVIADTVGFFLDNWQSQTFAVPAYQEAIIPDTVAHTVTVDAADVITQIPEAAFAHNANTWMTTMVDQPRLMEHITQLRPHLIRFPGGSSSDVYFWNAQTDEIPADAPPKLMDKDGNLKAPGYGFGRTNEAWRASLDDYYRMLELTGNRSILTVNYAYARYGTSADPVATAAQLAADWVRYDNGRTQYWEIGNENYADWEWGYRIDVAENKDGQPEYITGKLYARHFKVFADAMRKAAKEIGKTIYIGAVMQESEPQPWQVESMKTWNAMLAELDNQADFYIAHHYFTPYNHDSAADMILDAAISVPVNMMNYLRQTLQAAGAAIKPIAMTEWNMWASNRKQQVSNTSGVFALMVVAEAIKHKYGLAARWDLLNSWDDGNDHGMFSAGDELDVDKWMPRPSFYYLYYFRKMLGDRLVSTLDPSGSNLKSYAATYSSGQTSIHIVNMGAVAQSVQVRIRNFRMGSRFYWYCLEGSHDNGYFSRKVLVNGKGPAGIAGGPSDYATLKAHSATTAGGVKVTVPSLGAVCLVVDTDSTAT